MRRRRSEPVSRPRGGRSDRRGARRAAPRDDRVADDGHGLPEAERDSCALRGDRRLPPSARSDAGRGGGTDSRGPRRRRVRARLARGVRWDAVADGGAALGGDRDVGGRDRARRGRRSDLSRRVHRQPLAARGVRHRRVRLLPDALHGSALATRLVHSANERARVDDLVLGTEFLRYAAQAMG